MAAHLRSNPTTAPPQRRRCLAKTLLLLGAFLFLTLSCVTSRVSAEGGKGPREGGSAGEDPYAYLRMLSEPDLKKMILDKSHGALAPGVNVRPTKDEMIAVLIKLEEQEEQDAAFNARVREAMARKQRINHDEDPDAVDDDHSHHPTNEGNHNHNNHHHHHHHHQGNGESTEGNDEYGGAAKAGAHPRRRRNKLAPKRSEGAAAEGAVGAGKVKSLDGDDDFAPPSKEDYRTRRAAAAPSARPRRHTVKVLYCSG